MKPLPTPHNLHLWEPYIHAFVELSTDGTSGNGPLAGLSVGVKDIIDVAGTPTRNGSETCQHAEPATQDATSVAMLRTAGASIVGKTTTTEFAFTDPTACRNPHDLSRSPGGSSSGSGAAVAAGVVDVALGTQTAGSLCRPAAYCGVVGFKPTYGTFPTTGVTPLAPSFDTVGIIARSVDLAHQAFSVFAPWNETEAKNRRLRIVSECWQTQEAADEDTIAGFTAAKKAVGTLGIEMIKTPLAADVPAVVAAHRNVMNYEAFLAHGSLLDNKTTTALLKPKFRAGLRTGAKISQVEAAQAAAFLSRAKEAFWEGLQGVDLILTLPVPAGAPLIDGTTGFQDWLTPWTVFGGPLLCMPWGLDRLGRPISVMLAARPGQDALVLATAAKLERLSPVMPSPQLPLT